MSNQRICVFCGSSNGAYPHYRAEAYKLGQLIAQNSYELVYGGATVGTMGAVADGVMAAGGRVHGIIPDGLFGREIPHNGITNLEVVGTMHERKARMMQLSHAFITLPGGIGTFEEFFEVLSWAQLGIHRKPIGLLNLNHFYDGLLHFLDQAVEQGFVKQKFRDLLIVANNAETMLQNLTTAAPPLVSRWLDEGDI